MQHVIRKLEIHTLNALLALRHIGRTTLAAQILSFGVASRESEAFMRRIDESFDESGLLQRMLALFRGEGMAATVSAD